MATRRNFLQMNVAAATLSAFPGAVGALANEADASSTPDVVLFDDRTEEGRLFADRAQRLGVATHAVQDDLSAAWRHELSGRLRNGATRVAGVTTGHTAFLLSEMARDLGHSVTYSRPVAEDNLGDASPEENLAAFELNRPELVHWELSPAGIRFV